MIHKDSDKMLPEHSLVLSAALPFNSDIVIALYSQKGNQQSNSLQEND